MTAAEIRDRNLGSEGYLKEIAAQLAELTFAVAFIGQCLDRLAESQEEAHK